MRRKASLVVKGDCRSIYSVDLLQSIAFLLLALSSSRADDMCSPASLPSRGVKGDTSLYSFPVSQIFHVAKNLPSFAWHPSRL